MPYVLDDDEDKKDGGSGTAGVAQGGITSGGMSPTAPQPVASGQSAPGAASSPYVEFGRYLSANKAGADASASKLGNSIEAGGQDVQKQLGDQRTAFNAQVEAGKPAYMQQQPASGGGLKPAGSPQAGTATVKPAPPAGAIQATELTGTKPPVIQAADTAPVPPQGLQGTPTGGVPSITPEEAAARAHATYTGPNAMSENSAWAGLLDKGDQAQRRANLTGQRTSTGGLQGDSGIQTLLQEGHAGAGANYNQGQSRFDAALTGAAGRGRFGDLQRQYGDLSGSLKAADEQSKSTALGARMATDESGQAYSNALDDYNIGQQAINANGNTPQAAPDTSGPATGRGAWGQLDLTGGTLANQRASDAGKFSANGGSEATYNKMTQNQWTQFNQLYEAARASGDFSAVKAYVAQLESQGGSMDSSEQATQDVMKKMRGG